eukprot:g14393.t1
MDESEKRERMILLIDERGALMMNRYPYSNGHLLIAPKKHVADISDLSPAERAGLMELADLGCRLLRKTMHCQGVNMGMNLGRCAGAGVPGHCHMHLVPRWNGDSNFMQVVAGARVIPQALEESYAMLLEALQSADDFAQQVEAWLGAVGREEDGDPAADGDGLGGGDAQAADGLVQKFEGEHLGGALVVAYLADDGGRVWLVGAGPGDPGLITVAGLGALKACDAVVFDALANPVLLDQATATAERYDVGKRAKAHKLTQDETNQLLVDLAKQGKEVVRLKGGDPYLFGRGAEEAAFCTKQGVRCEVVPGVTSGIAAPATAGIPVTHRKVASTVTIITGHEDPTKGETSIDYQALADLIKAGGTACFYMGVGRLQAICDSLAACGLARSMPAALIQWGTLPRQRHVKGTLDDIKAKVDEAGLSSPAIIVVGEVAAIDEPGLDYFTNRPLFGQRILVTRTRQQASDLRTQLQDLGAEVLEAPTIQIAEPSDEASSALNAAIAAVSDYDAVIFTSGNAVHAFADRMALAGLDSRALSGVHLSCIGQATADVLSDRLACKADLVPARSIAESFVAELLDGAGLAGKRILLPQADIARPLLAEGLREAGCTVDVLTAYQTQEIDALPESVLKALRVGEVDWVTFTSSSTARNLAELLGDEADLLSHCRLASIGPKTSETMREHGMNVSIEAQQHDIDGLIAAILSEQEAYRLVQVMHERKKLKRRASRLLQGSNILNIPQLVTEQYPRGLGETIEEVVRYIRPECIQEKRRFTAYIPPIEERLNKMDVDSVVIAGVEAHICVLQTCLDLMQAGYKVYPVWDAISSRREEDKAAARERLTQAGAVPTTVESALFEWLGDADDSRFRQIQDLIKGETND